MVEIPAEEWVAIPIQARGKTSVLIEVACLKLVDYGVVADPNTWQKAKDRDSFESEYWHEEFQGSDEVPLELQERQKGYSLIFWNSNYSSGKISVAYRLAYGPSQV